METTQRRIPPILKALWLLTPLLQQIAWATTEAPPPSGQAPDLASRILGKMWIVFALIALSAAIATVAARLKRYERERLKGEEEAACRFEKSVTRSFEQTSSEPPRPLQPHQPPEAPECDIAPQARPRPTHAHTESPYETALARLRESGLVATEEDLVMTPGAPPLKFLRMQDGRTAIVFPTDTPLDEAERKQQAADLLVLPRTNAPPLVSALPTNSVNRPRVRRSSLPRRDQSCPDGHQRSRPWCWLRGNG